MASIPPISLVDSYSYCIRTHELPLWCEIQSRRRFRDPSSQPSDTIDWLAQRNNVSSADLHTPHSGIFDIISVILSEQCLIPPLRHAGAESVYKLIVYEDENTGY